MDLGDILRLGSGDWAAWWYSGFYRSDSRSTEPRVLVGFRKYLGAAFSDATTYRSVPLSALSQLTLGSIWTLGRCHLRMDLAEREFDVDFRDGGWRFTHFQDAQPYPFDRYPLRHPHDRNWMIEFSVGDSARLLVPCVEFFYRYYGVSAALKQIIASRPWSEAALDPDAHRLLYAADDKNQIISGTWHVTLRNYLHNDDAALLAYAKYRLDSRKAVKRIYAQLESSAGAAGQGLAFIQADPWFYEPTRMKLRGIPFGDGSFLGLEIVGLEQPQDGPEIVRDRENSNKVEEGAPSGSAPPAYPGTVKPRGEADATEDGVPMTGDDDPAWNTAFRDVQGEPLEILGAPLNVSDVWRAEGKYRSGGQKEADEQPAYSGGERYGDGKRVGKANIDTPHIRLINGGFLRSMWEALCGIAQRYSEVKRVDWFTLNKGLCSTPDPEMIPLAPLRRATDPARQMRPDWAYHRLDRTAARGLMVVRILTTQGQYFVVEIERRSEGPKEAFSGLAFRLEGNGDLGYWIRRLLPAIVAQRGVFKRCLTHCPPGAKTFKHSRKRVSPEEPLELAARNALAKLGLRPDEPK